MYKQTANYDCPKKTAQNNILFTGFAFLLKSYDRAYLHILILKYQYFNYFTVKGKRKRGRQKKRWEDNIKEWTGMDFASSTRAAENRSIWKGVVANSSVVPRRPSKVMG